MRPKLFAMFSDAAGVCRARSGLDRRVRVCEHKSREPDDSRSRLWVWVHCFRATSLSSIAGWWSNSAG